MICGDDGGAALSFNLGTIEAYRNGMMRCANVIAPGPWFPDMARRANENPGLAVGVHLDLTAEWDGVKWRPITGLQSLTDSNGYLPATTRGFLDRKAPLADVERELRAQIETAKRHIKNVGWLWAHMGTATATPELKALTLRLASEYGLPLLGSEGTLKIFAFRRARRSCRRWRRSVRGTGSSLSIRPRTTPNPGPSAM